MIENEGTQIKKMVRGRLYGRAASPSPLRSTWLKRWEIGCSHFQRDKHVQKAQSPESEHDSEGKSYSMGGILTILKS